MSDVRYWLCIGSTESQGEVVTFRLQAVKGKGQGVLHGPVIELQARAGSFEVDYVYDQDFNTVGPARSHCPYEGCDEPGNQAVKDEKGFMLRACMEHAPVYREAAHAAGKHEGWGWERACRECSPKGTEPDPRRFLT